jgi:hypothetical protein
MSGHSALAFLLSCLLLGSLQGQICGDIDGSGMVTVLDAHMIFEDSVGLQSHSFPPHADVDQSGVVDLADAYFIMQTASGVIAYLTCTPIPTAPVAPGAAAPSLQFTNPVLPGSQLTVEFHIDTETTLLGVYQARLEYDPGMLTLDTSLGIDGVLRIQCPPGGYPWKVNSSTPGLVVWVDGDGFSTCGGAVGAARLVFDVAPLCAGSTTIRYGLDVLLDDAANPIGTHAGAPLQSATVLCSVGPGPGCGDCDASGTVSIVDALVAAQASAGMITLVDPQFGRCNVAGMAGGTGGPGTVDILDALTIAQYTAGLLATLYCAP